MPRLRRSDCAAPGITRRGRGRGFEYLCLDPLGHLQATGIDDAGRKQYRYHDHWRTRRDREKFASMVDFGQALPVLRRRVRRDLSCEELDRLGVLACATRLLDLGFFRFGSEDYAVTNESYGLATMLKRHVTIERDEVVFDYPAKSGQRRIHSIADDEVREVVAALKRRRGGSDEILAYRNGRRWKDVRSDDINSYVKAVTSHDFSAKDFRTWNATVLAAIALTAGGHEPSSKPAYTRATSAAVKVVAAYLGNTPAVARSSYIDPRVFDRFRSGWTIADALRELGEPDLADPRKRTRIESAVLDLLEGE